MKKFCLIGGLGPESTIDYYKLIIKYYQNLKGKEECPEFFINSLNVNKLLDMVGRKEFDKLIDYLLVAIEAGYNAGADFAAIGANTPHIVFHKLKELSPIPLISIVEETGKKTKDLNIKNIGLLGTKFTMEEDFFKKELLKYGVTPFVPNDEEQDYIHGKIMTELELGIVKEDTKEEFLKIIERMKKENSVDGIILGCTELPLILRKEDEDNIKFLNTTEIHVESIVEKLII